MGLRPSVRPSSDKIDRMASSAVTITAGFTGIVGHCEHREPRAEGRGTEYLPEKNRHPRACNGCAGTGSNRRNEFRPFKR